jgi:hypothetical protein
LLDANKQIKHILAEVILEELKEIWGRAAIQIKGNSSKFVNLG